MSREIRELDRKVGFSGAGPHRVATGRWVPPGGRFGFQARFLIVDVATTNILYHASFHGTCHEEDAITIDTPTEVHAAAGWSGNVVVDVLIVDDEVVADVLTPAGYTLAISYKFEALIP